MGRCLVPTDRYRIRGEGTGGAKAVRNALTQTSGATLIRSVAGSSRGGSVKSRRAKLIGLVLAALVSAACMGAGTFAPSGAAVEAEKKQILAVIGQMQEAWNSGDFRGYMQGFKNPDVVFVSGGRIQDGWQGTLDHYIRDYGASIETRGKLRFYDMTVEMLAPDAAQLISHFELVRPLHPQYGINTRLMRKVNGHWVIALNHVSASETPPSN
jgi:ketosteroid isomerase-like protein